MASIVQNLETAYANYAVQLAAISANKKPSYSIDGESLTWTEYQQFIITQMETLRLAIQQAYGPFSRSSRARS